MKVVLASKNKHKLVEISQITEKFGFELVLQSELGVDIDVEENGSTFEENSFIKAEAVMKATGLPALADDSGIAVDALNGEPGIYSARYGFDESLDDWGRLLLLLKNKWPQWKKYLLPLLTFQKWRSIYSKRFNNLNTNIKGSIEKGPSEKSF